MTNQELLKVYSAYLPYGLKGNFEVSEVVPNGPFELRNKTLRVDNLEFFLKYAKPFLRPLSDLTKEIEHDGEKFVPILKLCEHSFSGISTPKIDRYETKVNNNEIILYFTKKEKCFTFSYSKKWQGFNLSTPEKRIYVFNQFDLFQMLFKWNFDVFGLLDKNLAINLNEVK